MNSHPIARLAVTFALVTLVAACHHRIPVPAGDAGTPEVATPKPTWPTCATAAGEGRLPQSGSDIIWFIDTSGSMNTEAAWVQQNLNDFAEHMGRQKLDYRVVLISATSICVPPPLGGPGCTDGPRFRHIKTRVGSRDGLSKILSTYPQWQGFLRASASKNFVAVTDDDSSLPAASFNSRLAGLSSPGFAGGYFFHSIVSYGALTKGCSTGARIGNVYLDLTQQTGGTKFQVCEKDWNAIFTNLAKTVSRMEKPPCSYPLPPPNPQAPIDPQRVMVSYAKGSDSASIPQVGSAASCSDNGWHYDNPNNPTAVVLCPRTCSSLIGASVRVYFGCATGRP